MKLKAIRIILAAVFFTSLLVVFLDITESTAVSFGIYLQFIPSLAGFLDSPSFLTSGFIVILLMTMAAGRIYCSCICPVGILQDMIIFVKKRFKRDKFRFAAPLKTRYLTLIAAGMAMLAGSMAANIILDPFANFGRIMTGILRPAGVYINNAAGLFLEKMNIYFLFQEKYPPVHLAALFFAATYLVVLGILCMKEGRIYCNSLCPVGALLGCISKRSIFKVAISREKCIQCGRCSQACSASCIDVLNKEVDNSRCIACFNCLGTCSEKAVSFSAGRNEKQESAGMGRKGFLKTVFFYTGSLLLFLKNREAFATGIEAEKTTPVSPPGSLSIRHLTDKCIGCHLCISACPSKVLEPSLFDYGMEGMFQPKMNYSRSFCNYECVRCSEVCPTGAIKKISREEKKQIQTGKVVFQIKKCVVYTNNKDCGACSEHCPTKAVFMTPYKDGLTIPGVEEKYCVGCGACEYICPAVPEKAIFVRGHAEHKRALNNSGGQEVSKGAVEEDFPF